MMLKGADSGIDAHASFELASKNVKFEFLDAYITRLVHDCLLKVVYKHMTLQSDLAVSKNVFLMSFVANYLPSKVLTTLEYVSTAPVK